jgi:hypothetical protein
LPSADEGGAVKPPAGAQAHTCGELVAEETNNAGSRKCPEVGELLRMDETLDRFEEGDAG